MLGFFVDSYPDELFISIMSRFQERSGYKKTIIYKELFGNNKRYVSLDFPGHLDSIVQQLPFGNRYSINEFINRNTLLPLFKPFIPASQVGALFDFMKGAKHKISNCIISRRLATLSIYFRYCPLCVEEDRKKFGETYWHRLHQIAGVVACPKHNVYLQNSTVNKKMLNRQDLITAESAIRILKANKVQRTKLILTKIAKDVAWLFNEENMRNGYDESRNRYYRILAEKKLVLPNNRIRINKLIKETLIALPHELITLINNELNSGSNSDPYTWIPQLVGRSPKGHPIRHILLIRSLGLSLQEFFSIHGCNINVSEQGPWPCLNPAADHYKQLLIEDCEISCDSHRGGGKLKAIFKCGCGFVYQKLEPYLYKESKNYKVKIYGQTWENTFISLWNEPVTTIDKIADQLKIKPAEAAYHAYRLGLKMRSDIVKPFNKITCRAKRIMNLWQDSNLSISYIARKNKLAINDVIYYALRLNLPYKQHVIIEKIKFPKLGITKISLNDRRKKLTDYLKQHPQYGRSQIHNGLGYTYDWLQKHDRKWLESVLPSSRLKKTWDLIDARLALIVSEKILEIKSNTNHPVRITLELIGRKVGFRFSKSNLKNLPFTKAIMDENIETAEDFAARKIQITVQYFVDINIQPVKYIFFSHARLSYVMAERPKVAVALNEAQDILKLCF